MKLSRLLILTVLLFGFYTANAQYSEPEKKEDVKSAEKEVPIKDKLHFGGTLGLQFGSYTSVYIAPIVFYDVAKNLMVGAGFNYIYQKYEWNNIDYKSSVYGPKLAAIFKPFKQLILSSEFEYNYYNRTNDYSGTPIEPYWHPTLYFGLGYGVPMGKRGGMYFSMSYDVLWDSSKSYYSTAWRLTIGAYF